MKKNKKKLMRFCSRWMLIRLFFTGRWSRNFECNVLAEWI